MAKPWSAPYLPFPPLPPPQKPSTNPRHPDASPSQQVTEKLTGMPSPSAPSGDASSSSTSADLVKGVAIESGSQAARLNVNVNPELPHPLPIQLQCARTTSGWRCPLPIMIGGQGMCTKHISKNLFKDITGQKRGQIREAKAMAMVEEKCSTVGGLYYFSPSPSKVAAVSVVKEPCTHVQPSNASQPLYKDMLAVHRCTSPPADFEVASRSSTCKEGDPAFLLTDEEFEKSIQLCKWQAVIRFPLPCPPMEKIREIINFKWGLSLPATVGALNVRHVQVKTESEEDYNKVLTMDSSKILNHIVRIFRWSPTFYSQRESPIVNRWIRLPALPSNFFAPSGLAGIGNAISRFISADPRTLSKEIPGYGRICIEVDLSKPLPSRVWLGTSLEAGFWQRIIVEGRIDYCIYCGLHGHSRSICRKAALDPNTSASDKEEPRLYCARCRMNNHATAMCRWIKSNKSTVDAPVHCTHCKKGSHSTDECWTLLRINRFVQKGVEAKGTGSVPSAAAAPIFLAESGTTEAGAPITSCAAESTKAAVPIISYAAESDTTKAAGPIADSLPSRGATSAENTASSTSAESNINIASSTNAGGNITLDATSAEYIASRTSAESNFNIASRTRAESQITLGAASQVQVGTATSQLQVGSAALGGSNIASHDAASHVALGGSTSPSVSNIVKHATEAAGAVQSAVANSSMNMGSEHRDNAAKVATDSTTVDALAARLEALAVSKVDADKGVVGKSWTSPFTPAAFTPAAFTPKRFPRSKYRSKDCEAVIPIRSANAFLRVRSLSEFDNLDQDDSDSDSSL